KSEAVFTHGELRNRARDFGNFGMRSLGRFLAPLYRVLHSRPGGWFNRRHEPVRAGSGRSITNAFERVDLVDHEAADLPRCRLHNRARLGFGAPRGAPPDE